MGANPPPPVALHSVESLLVTETTDDGPPAPPFADALREAKAGDLLPPSRGVDPILEDGDDTGIPDQEEFFRSPARFGSIPVEAFPLGWDRRQKFNKLYPFVSLPTQVVERVSFGNPQLPPNRLFWGDNLHVMRQLPSESIDLIYIDPPFFSGRPYNVIFGDQNEMRSFSDIWDDGMPGYLEWMNARVFEMKRVLRETGSLLLHLDWHASHYVKVELDKIFGHSQLINELIWAYSGAGVPKDRFARRHDTIFWYGPGRTWTFNVNDVREEYAPATRERFSHYIGNVRSGGDYGVQSLNPDGKHPEDVLKVSIAAPSSKERIGYPTQKPEALLERLVLAASSPGDVVADFFVGGGTTAAVAQRLGRRWIACDQSRVAVAVTADRLAKQSEQGVLQNMTGGGRPRFHYRTLGHVRGRAPFASTAGPVPPLHRRLRPAA